MGSLCVWIKWKNHQFFFYNESEMGAGIDPVMALTPFSYTVKLGYNELGYNEHSVITNTMFSPKWPFYYTKQPGYNNPGYNEQIWSVPSCSL